MKTTESEIIRQSGLFDNDWYALRYPDVALTCMDPLEHYIRIGSLLDRDPTPVFSATYYRKQLDRQWPAQNSALFHYINEGWRRRLNPHPLFDVAWYLQHNQDVADAAIEPLTHFFHTGAFEGRQPHAKFPTSELLRQHPSLVANRINPLAFYLEELARGVDLCPSASACLSQLGSLSKPKARYRMPPSATTAPLTPYKYTLKEAPIIPTVVFDPELPDTPTPYRKHEPLDATAKVIAFYLPQFHPFPENDEWWGKGFTEWTNVGRAAPNFTGHYQPHCPIHLGYYDLRVPSVMQEQAALAKNYGVHGFNYYFYWFAGKTLMEAPLDAMLKNPKIDMPFCLTWANENWTRRWDGQENDILIAQNHSNNDSRALIKHLIKYFRDPRYIRVEGCPLFVVYRPDIIPDIARTADLWRQEMAAAGFQGIYLVAAQTFGSTSPKPFGFDAAVEFPPHSAVSSEIKHKCGEIRPEFEGSVYSYEEVVSNAVQRPEPEYKLFRTAMLSWDNTARKQNSSHVFHGFSLARYKQWLNALFVNCTTSTKYSDGEKLVFVNAWNEWAEGTHLEPDQRFGYGYLQVTRDALAPFERHHFQWLSNKPADQTSRYAIIVHVHYGDVWPDLSRRIRLCFPKGIDVFCSVTNAQFAEEIRRDFPLSYITLVENRGRDILPFIKLLKIVQSFNYNAICKVHTKKSIYRHDGPGIRESLLDGLLGGEQEAQGICARFGKNEDIGLACPAKFLLPHTDHNMTFNTAIVNDVASKLGIPFTYSVFPAGSMFWFRPEALSTIAALDNALFPLEAGLADGTPAHAVERLFGVVVKNAGFQTLAV